MEGIERAGAAAPAAGAGAAVGPEPRTRRSSQVGEQFSYGGVGFEILADFEADLGEEHRSFAAPFLGTPTVAEVRCAVSGDPSLAGDRSGREIHWDWRGECAQVRTARARLDLHRLAPGHYAASARTAPNTNGLSGMVTAVTGTIVHREGGLVLHAAGVVLGGRAVLFIGPSGAGKTTAANQSDGASWLARDRAAILPGAGGWTAWGMAGGDTIRLPQSARRSYPLAGVLRVRRGDGERPIRDLTGAEALSVVRESVQSAGGSREEEDRRFEAMARLLAEARVGEIRTELRKPVSDRVTQWLGEVAE